MLPAGYPYSERSRGNKIHQLAVDKTPEKEEPQGVRFHPLKIYGDDGDEKLNSKEHLIEPRGRDHTGDQILVILRGSIVRLVSHHERDSGHDRQEHISIGKGR